MAKIYCWDIETSGLNGNGGFVLTASVVDASKPSKVLRAFRIDDYKGWKNDPGNDFALVRDLSKYLATADVWVTYYGKRFDHPFVSTRIVYWRGRGRSIEHLENVPHIDLYDTAKRRLRLHSNRLQVVSDLLGHGDKTSLELPVWIKAAGGHKKSIDYVAKHCDKDAIILAKNYVELRPLVPAHPHIGLLNTRDLSCTACGSQRVQKRGFYVTPATKRQRISCQECGKWGSIPFRDPATGVHKKGGKSGRR